MLLRRFIRNLLAAAPILGFSTDAIVEQCLPGAEKSLEAYQINAQAKKEMEEYYAQQKDAQNSDSQEIAADSPETAPDTHEVAADAEPTTDQSILKETLPGAEQSLKAYTINAEGRKLMGEDPQQNNTPTEISQEIAQEDSAKAPSAPPRTLLQAQRHDHPSMNLP